MAKRELFFKKYGGERQGGRWCKKIDGKLEYFGTARSASDRQGYREARAKYHAFRDRRAARLEAVATYGPAAQAYLHARTKEVFGDAFEAELERITSKQVVDHEADDAEDPVYAQMRAQERQSLDDLMYLIERPSILERFAANQADRTPPEGATIADHIEAWLEQQRANWGNGEITEKSYVSKRYGIATLREYARQGVFGSAQEVELFLGKYRLLLLQRQRAGKYAANTVNDKLKFLRQFIKWCYECRVLHELPRSLEKVSKNVPVQKGGQPLTKAQVRKLYRQADERMRAWITLGLNCGFKNRDIAELRGRDIRSGRLMTLRHKTQVPMNMKLWPLTQRLIGRTRQGDGDADLLYVNREGQPVTRDRSDNLGAAFRKLASAAGGDATFQQLRDTGAEFVRTWNRERGQADGALVQLYLAHKDSSTAQFYVSQAPEDVRAPVLDEATDALSEWLGLGE